MRTAGRLTEDAAISSPSSSVVAVRPPSPTIDPSYITTIRSASTCTSSRSR